MTTAAKIIALLYSPHSRIANLDRDGLRAPEIAAACDASEEDVERALPGLERTRMVYVDRKTGDIYRPTPMMAVQLND